MRILISVAAIASLSLITACDGPTEATTTTPDPTAEPTTPDPEPVRETPSQTVDELPFLVSRYGPMTGLSGTHIRILTAFDPSGCAAVGECAVTIDDQPVEIVADAHLLEVVVPRFVATGPLCVTWKGRTECGEDFVVLDKPVVWSVYPAEVALGSTDVIVELSGDGFTEGAQLLIGNDRLEVTQPTANKISATIPAAHFAVSGTLLLNVYVPNVNRCGAISESIELIVRPE